MISVSVEYKYKIFNFFTTILPNFRVTIAKNIYIRQLVLCYEVGFYIQ